MIQFSIYLWLQNKQVMEVPTLQTGDYQNLLSLDVHKKNAYIDTHTHVKFQKV